MDLRHFRYFIAVAETLHFAQAADKLGIAAPTLTVQIQEMERQLRAQLFHRTKRTVRLTATGEAFLIEARQAVAHFERSIDLGRRMGRGALGKVAIGYVGSAVLSGVLQEQVKVFRQSWPEVLVEIKEYPMGQLPPLLDDEVIDVAFVRLPVALDASLQAHPLLCDQYCLAVQKGHVLASQSGAVDARQLIDEGFIAPEQLEGTYEVGRRGGFVPRIVSSPGSLLSVLVQVSLGAGVAVVPDMLEAVMHLPDVVFVPVAGGVLVSELAVVFRCNEMSPAVNNFIRQMQQIPSAKVSAT
jgi:DNA-binding transcriptional LysR family regulator